MLKKGLKLLTSRLFIVGVLILVQVIVLTLFIIRLSEYFTYAYFLFATLSLIVVLYIVNRDDNPSYKLAWIVPIMAFPIIGGPFYLMFGGKQASNNLKAQIKYSLEKTLSFCNQDKDVIQEISMQDKSAANQSAYIHKHSFLPIYKNTTTKYLSSGEAFFERLLEELEKAEHFIFMEYFIVEQGKMWNTILEVLAKKASAGVEVRMMYDDAGTITVLPYKYHDHLESLGIKTVVFNKLNPTLSIYMNNRDHRKITVIDGHTGFIGGVNLADEYINEVEKFGHWKDAALYLKGDAVWSLSLMFIQVWNFSTEDKLFNFLHYKPHENYTQPFESDGYVQPYGDSPLDNESTGESVYLNIINRAKDYVYINTPYFIVDNEIITALSLASKSGVEIIIVTPHIEDKWYAHVLTRSYYAQLIKAGIKVYEYTPGFIHSKTFVCDDEIGVVGTINLDYRSLYLHFECGVWMYKTKSVLEIKDDFLKTLEICKPITLEEAQNIKWGTKAVASVLKLFSPLM
ncbi:cardiolipin synthase [Candidatus Epulonipiscium fishelsonii]|uniref:Cardiolipin synthase n=1 Tax=Candidatus Epulonipiscium fishelsonii TaxID=77094 RepID=A0ACC8XAP3_9FIRM|nr:cardiolipin synthase [Epulopiscium sp. SCG-B11WGA-EpuloA1]ONI40153.1 cardiolipin synthase [Epulopiscium sp. SCG-B05WGA-EpuloA1]